MIATVTLNPAYDVHCEMGALVCGKENLVTAMKRVAGGKGVNISRALTKSEIKNKAVVVVGRENGTEFLNSLAEDGMDVLPLVVPGRIRENLTFHPAEGPETRISFTGLEATEAILEDVSGALSFLKEGDVLAFTGRIPAGISCKAVTEFLSGLKKRGIRIAVDSGNYPLEEIMALGPWLIKPNEQEAAQHLGYEMDTFPSVQKAAAFFAGAVENVIISLGGRGAYLHSPQGCFLASPPKIKAISTVGAGDSSIAGFLAATTEELPVDACLCRAVAFGSAACKLEGTLPPDPADIAEILRDVIVERY